MVLIFQEAEVVLSDVSIEENVDEVSDPSSLMFGSRGFGYVDS